MVARSHVRWCGVSLRCGKRCQGVLPSVLGFAFVAVCAYECPSLFVVFVFHRMCRVPVAKGPRATRPHFCWVVAPRAGMIASSATARGGPAETSDGALFAPLAKRVARPNSSGNREVHTKRSFEHSCMTRIIDRIERTPTCFPLYNFMLNTTMKSLDAACKKGNAEWTGEHKSLGRVPRSWMSELLIRRPDFHPGHAPESVRPEPAASGHVVLLPDADGRDDAVSQGLGRPPTLPPLRSRVAQRK